MAPAFAVLLEPEGHVVEYIDDRYPPEEYPDGVEDVRWINDLSDEGEWIVISRDSRIVSNPHERKALTEGDLIVYVLAAGWRHQTKWPMTWGLFRWWERILRHADKSPRRAVYKVPFRYSEKSDAIKKLL